jgi:GTP1/Obg family GTP-binding protein
MDKKDLIYTRDMLIDIKKVCYNMIEQKNTLLQELSSNIENLVNISNNMNKNDVIKNIIRKKNELDKKNEEEIITIKKEYY